MNNARPIFIASFAGTYLAGLASGICIQKYVFGPPR